MLEESPADVAAETEEMHPADLADVAELLEREQLSAFLTALPPARAADVLEYLDEELRTRVPRGDDAARRPRSSSRR